MSEPLHLNKTHLPCNSESCRADPGAPKDANGDRLLEKFTETLMIQVSEDPEKWDVYCRHCENWLCGDYDAFGNLQLQSISIVRILEMITHNK